MKSDIEKGINLISLSEFLYLIWRCYFSCCNSLSEKRGKKNTTVLNNVKIKKKKQA